MKVKIRKRKHIYVKLFFMIKPYEHWWILTIQFKYMCNHNVIPTVYMSIASWKGIMGFKH